VLFAVENPGDGFWRTLVARTGGASSLGGAAAAAPVLLVSAVVLGLPVGTVVSLAVIAGLPAIAGMRMRCWAVGCCAGTLRRRPLLGREPVRATAVEIGTLLALFATAVLGFVEFEGLVSDWLSVGAGLTYIALRLAVFDRCRERPVRRAPRLLCAGALVLFAAVTLAVSVV
jgi:hypothetical protein